MVGEHAEGPRLRAALLRDLALLTWLFKGRILADGQCTSVIPAVHCQDEPVRARVSQRPQQSTSAPPGLTLPVLSDLLLGRIRTHIPEVAVDPSLSCYLCSERFLASQVCYPQCDLFPRLRLQIEVDRSTVFQLLWRIARRYLLYRERVASHEEFVSPGCSPTHALPLRGDAILEQVHVGLEHVLCQLLQRSVTRSWIATVGRPFMSRLQVPPPFTEACTANSVPTNSKFGLRTSSRTT